MSSNSNSLTPLFRANNSRLTSNFKIEEKTELYNDSDTMSEKSLSDDLDDYNYFLQIRKLQAKCLEQNQPEWKYSLRKLFESDLF